MTLFQSRYKWSFLSGRSSPVDFNVDFSADYNENFNVDFKVKVNDQV